MRLFNTHKLVGHKAEKKLTVTVCSYNLGQGFEERHKLIPVAEAQRKPLVRYRPLATPDEEIVVARRSPLEELAAWAAEEVAKIPLGIACQPPALARPQGSLISAFSSDVDDDDIEVLYSPKNSESGMPVLIKDRELSSPTGMDLDRWLVYSAQPSLLSLNAAPTRQNMRHRAWASGQV